MEQRAQKILESTVQGFIETGEPVSSGWLFNNYHFGIKPAMIRLELEDLTDDGFLAQPYHSAGRVPTDRGYEFFVEQTLSETSMVMAPFLKTLQSLFERQIWGDLVDNISEELGVFGVLDDKEEGETYKEGLENLIHNLDWNTKEELSFIIRDCEAVDKKINRLAEKIPAGETQVFVGRKNPVSRSENISVVVSAYKRGSEGVTLLAVGPKRMDYKKAIKIFKSLNQ